MATEMTKPQTDTSVSNLTPIVMRTYDMGSEGHYVNVYDLRLWLDRLTLSWHRPFMSPSKVVAALKKELADL